jgi:hypothetical protein
MATSSPTYMQLAQEVEVQERKGHERGYEYEYEYEYFVTPFYGNSFSTTTTTSVLSCLSSTPFCQRVRVRVRPSLPCLTFPLPKNSHSNLQSRSLARSLAPQNLASSSFARPPPESILSCLSYIYMNREKPPDNRAAAFSRVGMHMHARIYAYIWCCAVKELDLRSF